MDLTSLLDIIKKKLDIFAAVFVLTASLLFIIITLSKGNEINGLPILTMFIAIIYGIFKKYNRDFEIHVKSKKSIMLVNNIIFIFLFIIYISYIYTTQYPYDLLCFILLSLIASSILFSIFFSKNSDNWIILLKINLLTSLCIASNYYASPDVYGIDALFHSRFSEYIISSHHLPTIGEFSTYYYTYPILHIYTAELNNISSLTVKNSFFIIGLFESIIPSLFIYLIGAMNPRNDGQVGLVAAYLYCGSSLTLQRRWVICPNSFAIILFCLIIYLILKNSSENSSFSLIFVISTISLALIHPYPLLVLTVVIILVSGLYFIWGVICNNHAAQKCILSPLNSLVLMCTIYIAQLTIRSYDLLFKDILNSFSYGYWECRPPLEYMVKPLQYNIYNSLGHNILLMFSLFTIFTWTNHKYINIKRVILLLMYFVMIFMIYIPVIFKIDSVPLPDRIWEFAYIPISILGAYGIIYFVRIIFERYKKANYIIASVILLFIYFLSITSSGVSPDKGFYTDETSYRLFLTNSELAGFNYLIDSNRTFQSDDFYNSYLKYKGYNQNMICEMDPSIKYEYPVLLREYFLNKPSIRYQSYFPKTKNTQISQTNFEKIMGIRNKSIVYENGNVWIYDSVT